MSDAYNESPIDNSSNDNHLIDTELQVRLMNLVMGEASDFERDQLQLLMELRPELAAYCKHLEHLHGLLSEVGAGEPSIDVDSETVDAEWRLPADRRERVLAVLENRSSNPPPKVTLANQRSFRNWRTTTMEAIVVASIACVVLGLMLPATQSAREAGRRLSIRGGSADSFRIAEMAPLAAPANRAVVGKALNTVLTASEPVAPDAATTDFYSHPSTFGSLNEAYVNGGKGLPDDLNSVSVAGGKVMSKSTTTSVDNALKMLDQDRKGNMEGKPSSSTGKEVTRELGSAPNGTSAMARNSNGGSVAGQTLTSPYYLSDDVQYFPASPENKLASEPPVSGTLDGLAVQEKGQPYGEQQLAESKFGLAADGEIAKANRGTTASKPSEVVAPSVPNNAAPLEPIPSISITPNYRYIQPGAAAPAFTPELDLKVPNNEVLPDANFSSFLSYDETGRKTSGTENVDSTKTTIAPAKPNLHWEDGLWVADPSKNGSLDAVESKVNAPLLGQQEVPYTVNVPPVIDQDVKSYTVSVPENGTILLGGIKRNREEKSETVTNPDAGSLTQGSINRLFNNDVSDTSTLMMTVTPRIIIPEEEEEPLGVNLSETGPEIASRDRIELKKESKPSAPEQPVTLDQQSAQTGKEWPKPDADTKDSGYPLTNRLNPNGTKEIVMGIAEGGITLQQNTDYVAAGRINVSPTLGEIKNEKMRNWKSQTAPSPELATNGRDRANVEGKPTTPKQPVALDEQSAAAEAFSTFSLHVSDVSFKLAQAALSQSQWPEPAKIRIEEFVNALDYHDPLPSGDQKIACRVEQAIHPFLMQRNLLRVSMRTAAAGRSQNTPLRLTLLLDNSGSMERPDRRQAVLRAFQTLTQQLKATDQITLISFASSPRLLADKVPGNQGETLLQLIETLPSEGGTNIESALQLAREKAAEQQVAGALNRIVLLTDGAVNLGDANPENLARQVTQMRDAGIAFDAAGISAQDLNDEVLEALTRQGDGRYYLLDSAESASESFAAQIAGSLRPSAQNVKVQIEFNPLRVGRYKLLGYEKHRLNKEDFRNDQVDAAEMAAAEAGVAVYQYEIKPKGSGDVGSVSVRFRDLSTGQMVEHRWPILYESNTPELEQSQPSMHLAAAAALFAAKLGGGPLADSVDLGQLQKLVAGLPEQFAKQPRVQQLRTMIEQAIAIH